MDSNSYKTLIILQKETLARRARVKETHDKEEAEAKLKEEEDKILQENLTKQLEEDKIAQEKMLAQSGEVISTLYQETIGSIIIYVTAIYILLPYLSLWQ